MSLQVGFLRGKQSSIDTLLAQSGDRFQAGAFYITEDSNRIYFAQSATNLQYLNKYITTVAKVSDLPTDLSSNNIGDFYYIVDGNILCRYDGDATESGVSGKPQWTQVNAQIPDTDTTNKVVSLAISDGALNEDEDTIEFTLTATERKYDVKSDTPVGEAYNIVTDPDKKFILNKTILDNWYNKAAIELKDSVTDNKATMSLSGSGVGTNTSVVITGGTNITIKDVEDGFEISATNTNTTYNMVSPANEAKIHLDSSVGDNDAGTVEFKAGTDLIVSGTTTNEISYSHKTDGYLTATSKQVTDAQTPHQDETFDIITGVQTSNGHVTAVNTSTVKLPYISAIENYVSETTSENPTGKISIVVTDGAGDKKTVTSTEQFGLKVGSTLVPLGGDLKDHFYTEGEINDKFAEHLKSVNAMVFKGALPAAFPSNPSIGDTYIVNADSSLAIDGKTLQKGDIVIASGTEDDNGVIATPTWILVEANEIDTTYTLAAVGDYIALTPSTATGDDTQIQKIALTDDTVVTLSTTTKKIQDGNSEKTIDAIKVEHSTTNPEDKAPTDVTQLNYADANGFLVVTNVDANEYGHVTKIESAKIQLPGVQTLSHNAETGATELINGKSGDPVGSIDIDGSGIITVEAEDNGQGTNYTISHNDANWTEPTTPEDEAAEILESNKCFTAVTGVNKDNYGHITGYTVSKYKLPVDKDTTYTLSGTVTAEGVNSVKITDTLTDNVSGNADTKSEFVLKSDNTNLTVAATAATNDNPSTVTIDLVWGTF